MNPPAFVKGHGTISRLTLKEMANLEFGIRGKMVTFGELVCLFDLVNTCMPLHISQFCLGHLEAQSNPFIYRSETHRPNLPHKSVLGGTHQHRIKTI